MENPRAVGIESYDRRMWGRRRFAGSGRRSKELSFRRAEAVGAKDEPQASLHLKIAKDDIEYAERMIEENKNDEARAALERAKYDANLALALTEEVKTKEAAEKAAARVQELKKENGDLS